MTEKQIFDYLVSKGMTGAGAAGLMGNLMAESGLRSNNVQNSFEKSLGMDDETYTAAVDSGVYQNFVHDSAGYGLAQWTYWSRKQNLLNFAKKQGKSIGDCQMQLDFLIEEIKGYAAVWAILTVATNIRTASDSVLLQYERPADQSDRVKQSRAAMGQEIYKRCFGVTTQAQGTQIQNGNKTRDFSPLIKEYIEFGLLKCNPRFNRVSKITIHHMAGIMTGAECARSHRDDPAREASANYYIGNEGDICGGIRENYRAWTSGTGNIPNTNDHMAITIEVSNNRIGEEKTRKGWTVSNEAYKSLIALCADICQFYGINPHYDGTPNGSLTMHNQFQATACPGEQLWNAIESGQVERDILAAMGNRKTVAPSVSAPQTLYRVQIGAFVDKANADRLAKELALKGENSIITQANGMFKVQVGAFANLENAKRKSEALIKSGYKTYISEVTK